MVVQVSSRDIFGSVLLQSPSRHDFDQRDMFCLYLYPGNGSTRQVCWPFHLLPLSTVVSST